MLVNNAGLGGFAPVDELEPELFREIVETNLHGAFYGMHAAAPVMKRQGSGFIFNIASLAAKNPFAGGAAYNASKFGLVGMSEAAMLDLRHYGIRVAAICPGSVETDFGCGSDAQRRRLAARARGRRARRGRPARLPRPGAAQPDRAQAQPPTEEGVGSDGTTRSGGDGGRYGATADQPASPSHSKRST